MLLLLVFFRFTFWSRLFYNFLLLFSASQLNLKAMFLLINTYRCLKYESSSMFYLFWTLHVLHLEILWHRFILRPKLYLRRLIVFIVDIWISSICIRNIFVSIIGRFRYKSRRNDEINIVVGLILNENRLIVIDPCRRVDTEGTIDVGFG